MPDLEIHDFSLDFFERHSSEIMDIAGDVLGEYWTAENFRQDLPEKWSLSLLLAKGALPVGYAIASRKGPDQVHLHHFMVHRNWRGRSCGEAMLSELECRASEAGAARLTLKTPSMSSAAKRFYERSGYRLVDSVDDYDLYEKRL